VLRSHGHVIHVTVRLQLGKNAFLRTSSVVVVDHAGGLQLLVRDNHLEIKAVFVWLKQIELDRSLLLLLAQRSHHDEATFPRPGLRLPLRLEVVSVLVDTIPMLAAFNSIIFLSSTNR